MTIFISFLFTLNTLTTQVKDTSYKIKDTCKIEFINNLITNYSNLNGYWCVTNYSNCKYDSLSVELVSLKDIYTLYNSMKHWGDSTKYLDRLKNVIINNGGLGVCKIIDNGELVQLLPKKTIYKNKLNKLYKYAIKKVLHKYFDKDKQLKKKYLTYQYELVWYCYENNVIVFADGSGKCFYLEPEVCKNRAL